VPGTIPPPDGIGLRLSTRLSMRQRNGMGERATARARRTCPATTPALVSRRAAARTDQSDDRPHRCGGAAASAGARSLG
jgi:hypothetical protein